MSARQGQSITSKYQSWNCSSPSQRVFSGWGPYPSGQRTQLNASISCTSKHPARTPTATITLHRSATTSIVRRSAGISTSQPDLRRQFPQNPAWRMELMTLIGYSTRSTMTTTGKLSFPTSSRLPIHLEQLLIYSQLRHTFDRSKTITPSLEHSLPL